MPLNLESELIFVGGYFRSGTSMMQGLLCKAPETGDVTRESSYLRGLMEAYVMGLQRFDVNTYDFFGSSKEEYRKFNEMILRKYLRMVENRFGDTRMVFKEPMTTSCFPEMADLMPKAKFVVMVRDIRDVIASQAKRAANEGKNYSRQDVNKDLEEYSSMYRRLKNSGSLLGERVIYVSFESLVNNPQDELKRVTDFLGISEVDASEWPSKRLVSEPSGTEHEGRPVTAEPVGRHREILHPGLISELERIGNQMSGNLGIQCIHESAGAVQGGSTSTGGVSVTSDPSEKPARSDDNFGGGAGSPGGGVGPWI